MRTIDDLLKKKKLLSKNDLKNYFATRIISCGGLTVNGLTNENKTSLKISFECNLENPCPACAYIMQTMPSVKEELNGLLHKG